MMLLLSYQQEVLLLLLLLLLMLLLLLLMMMMMMMRLVQLLHPVLEVPVGCWLGAGQPGVPLPAREGAVLAES
jgi:hypothetical protein